MQRLKDEQETFEKKIQHLEEQNQLIARERESILLLSMLEFSFLFAGFYMVLGHLYTRGQ